MRSASGHNYRNSSVIVDLAMGQITRSTERISNYYIFILFKPWYFIPRVLKLAKAKMYVRSVYDGDSETVNVLARHTALKR